MKRLLSFTILIILSSATAHTQRVYIGGDISLGSYEKGNYGATEIAAVAGTTLLHPLHIGAGVGLTFIDGLSAGVPLFANASIGTGRAISPYIDGRLGYFFMKKGHPDNQRGQLYSRIGGGIKVYNFYGLVSYSNVGLKNTQLNYSTTSHLNGIIFSVGVKF